MRNLIIVGTAGLLLALGAVCAYAGPANCPGSPPDAAYEAISSADLLVEGRAAYETGASPYGELVNEFRVSVNYGAPASARDFGGDEYIVGD